MRGERSLYIDRSGYRGVRSGKGVKKRIALSVDLLPSARTEGVTQDASMIREQLSKLVT